MHFFVSRHACYFPNSFVLFAIFLTVLNEEGKSSDSLSCVASISDVVSLSLIHLVFSLLSKLDEMLLSGGGGII